MSKVHTRFQTKNPTPWGEYTYMAYKGVPPPPPPVSVNLKECEDNTTKVVSFSMIDGM